MARTRRIEPAKVTGLFGKAVTGIARRKTGQVPDSLGVMFHNKAVLKTFLGFAGKAEKWAACDRQLKAFAHMVTVAKVGCSFCLDYGYFKANSEKLDLEKARDVPRWRESSRFDALERDVLEYAERMTETPPAVTDELFARLLRQIGAPALLELTAFIGFANVVSRMNVALGIESQGFAAACGLAPLAAPLRT